MDLRQATAAVLTISMFVMLGNMIKKEHVDPLLGNDPFETELQLKAVKISRHYRIKLSTFRNGPWMEDEQAPRPCWRKLPHDDAPETRGHIFFTLSHGPEYHAFQVGIAIMIASKLGAALVLPDIRCNETSKDKRLFGELYDSKHFITSLEGIVHIVKDPPNEESGRKIITVRISTSISEEVIAAKIETLLRKRKQVQLAFDSTSASKGKAKETKYLNPYTCMAMFGSLKLQAELQAVVDSIVGTLRSWSPRSFGKFVALDLRTEESQNNDFQKNSTRIKQYLSDTRGTAHFLKRIGFDRYTTLYVTQAGRQDESLLSLRRYFPTTITKEAIFPMDLKAKYLEDAEFGKLIDFYICTQSDVFVSGFHDHFQSSVVAMRIASGKTQILSPAETSSSFASDFVPSYASKKTHMAYSCFC